MSSIESTIKDAYYTVLMDETVENTMPAHVNRGEDHPTVHIINPIPIETIKGLIARGVKSHV